MHVVARLPPDLLARIRGVLTPSDDLLVAPDLAGLAALLRTHPVDLVILDPADRRPDGGTEAERDASALSVLTEFRGVPFVAYTSYTREAMRAVLPLARSGVQQVLLRGFDDTRARLRDVIDQTGARILGQRLLDVMVPMLEEVEAPRELIAALIRLFESPQSFRTVPQLASACGRQRGMLDRWLRRAGLAPAKVVMVAARVAWTHHYAQSPGNRLKVLALRLGYAGSLPLSRHIKWMTGMTPTTLRRTLSSDELVPVLLGRIVLPVRAHR